MKKLLIGLPLAAATFFTGCAKDDSVRLSCGGQDIEITSVYEGVTGDAFTVESLEITDRCLTVQISHQGCSPADWTMDLITDGEYGGTSPTETYATLYLDDKLGDGEFTCAAQSERSFTFDLSPYLRDEVLPTRFTLHGAIVYAVDSVLVID